MTNYKERTKRVYDRYAKDFEAKTKDYLERHIIFDASLFISNLQGKRILDLGSGPGRDALFFKSRGLSPVCLDISPKMVEICQKNGLEAQIGDIESIPFRDNSFAGVWAYASLLHLPKRKLTKVLSRINELLIPEGVFYMGMKEGNFEGVIKSEKYGENERFFALYQDGELRAALRIAGFNVIHSSHVLLGDAKFLNYLSIKV